MQNSSSLLLIGAEIERGKYNRLNKRYLLLY